MSKFVKISIVVLAVFFVGRMAYATVTVPPNLMQGSSGQEVMDLQAALGGLTMDGSFGPLTRSVVVTYQSSHSLVADGVVGPMTAASINASAPVTTGTAVTCPTGFTCTSNTTPPVTCPVGYTCTSNTTGNTTTGGLTGGAGSVEDYTLMSSLNNEEVGEDEEDVSVIGLEIEADGNSDIELTAVRVNFDDAAESADALVTADQDFDNYASEVSIWLDGEEVARVDADEFTDDNNFEKTITLDSGAVIDAGETGELEVAVSGISNLDSTDDNEPWEVDIETVRFVDGQNASTSETPGTSPAGRNFSFETFATAAEAEFKIASDNDAVNDPHILNVHATDESESEDVELMSFTLEAEGDSDLDIKKFGVNLDVTGVTHVDDVVAGGVTPSIHLIIDGEEYGTATYGGAGAGAYVEDTNGDVGTDESVLFDDINYTLAAGETVEAMITVDLLAVDTDLVEGATIAASITEATITDEITFVEIEDETGENIVDADITGTVSAGAHGIYDIFIDVDLVSTTKEVLADDDADDNDIVTFTMVFDITAEGGSVYVGDTSVATTAANADIGDGAAGNATITDGILYRVYDSGTATTDDLADLITFTTPNGVTDSTDNILITDGSTSRVTMTVTQTNDTAEDNGIYYLDLAAIGWGIADDTTYEFIYNYGLEEFKTGTVTIN